MTVILLLIYFITIAGVIVTVLVENRNPLKATAWVLVVGFIPFLGLISYIIFGQDQRRLHRISRRVYNRLKSYPRRQSYQAHEQSPLPESLRHWHPLEQLLCEAKQSEVLSCSTCDIFTSGKAMYDRLLEDITQAKRHIHLQAYIFEQGRFFDALQDLLIQKRQEGVEVRILYDYLGSYAVERATWSKWQEVGIQIYPFLPVILPLLSSTVNYRNHRKVSVIDGSVGYIGGMNFADRYSDGDDLGRWRDTHFRLEGEAVSALQSSFLIDWYTASRRILSPERYIVSPLSTSADQGALMQFVTGGPMDAHSIIEQSLMAVITRARSHIYIQTPYFLPTEALYKALILVCQSGIRVSLMLPERGDSKLTGLASASYLNDLLEVGMDIYFYQGGFLHSKLILIDGEVAGIGSANLDFRSLEQNFEILGLAYNEPFARRLEAIYQEDLRHCYQLRLEAWQARTFKRRFTESVARLFAPLL